MYRQSICGKQAQVSCEVERGEVKLWYNELHLGPIYVPAPSSSRFLLAGGELWLRNTRAERDRERQRDKHRKDDVESISLVSLGFPSPLSTSLRTPNFAKHCCQACLRQLNCICFLFASNESSVTLLYNELLINVIKEQPSSVTVGSSCSGHPTKTLPASGNFTPLPGNTRFG